MDNLSRPNIARVWNAALGGKDNFALDRALLADITEVAPQFRDLAKANEEFKLRACKRLTRELGITQYLELSCGLPAEGVYLHEVVTALNPMARVLYVDGDPIVVSHARGQIAGDRRALALEADAVDPDRLLQRDEVRFLDWTKPIAIICTATLHYHSGELAAAVMQTYIDAAPPGSCTVLSHFLDPEDASTGAVRRIEKQLHASPVGTGAFRTLAEIRALFPDQDLLDPGVVRCYQWPDLDTEAASWIQGCVAGGVGQKRTTA
ncbi:SAM-dependent methyltransferase [Kribbella sp. NPDC023972]|uniref:SAM-dependent methyltransferase n=1 Tax=Kribbella sp. NPDC023972 TaxID=3154795 RepID=UPI0034079E69